MLKIIACDDDAAFLDRLHRMIDRWSIETGTAVDVALVTRGEDLLARIASLPAEENAYLIANYTALPPVHEVLTNVSQVQQSQREEPSRSRSACHAPSALRCVRQA